jgi:hypothetical protein
MLGLVSASDAALAMRWVPVAAQLPWSQPSLQIQTEGLDFRNPIAG